MGDTPPYRHPVPTPGETTEQYRLRVLENAVTAMATRFDKHIATMQEERVLQATAIERCSRHDTDIKTLRGEVDELRNGSDNNASRAARTIYDVLWHPASPMAFCMVVMVVFFVIFASARTGRDANTLVPVMGASGVGGSRGGTSTTPTAAPGDLP